MDYYYDMESEQFTFYRLPKFFFKGGPPEFLQMSTDAKVLYGLLLDRMGLSARTKKWRDSNGRIFIYYKMEEVMEDLGTKHDKVTKLFRELETAGLIRRKKQGQGKPTMIYVMNYSRRPGEEPEPIDSKQETRPEIQSAKKSQSEPPKIQSAENPQSGKREIRTLESGKSAVPYINEIEKSKIKSINQSVTAAAEIPEADPELTTTADMMNMAKDFTGWREAIRLQIDADNLTADYPEYADTINRTADLIAEVCASDRPTVRIGRQSCRRAPVRERLESPPRGGVS